MSNLSGMTGFARTTGSALGVNWVWEARSVNGKGLDLRLRLPSDFTRIEIPVRKAFSDVFKRGNIQISLNFQSATADSAYQINEPLFKELTAFANRHKAAAGMGELLQVPGVVVEMAEERSDGDKAALGAAITKSANELVTRLKSARDSEGDALGPVMLAALKEAEAITEKAEKHAASQPAAIRDRLKTKLAELLGDDIPEERLAQEAALLAMKADIREELDRLAAHCKEGRKLLAQGSPIGRKLDFLAQEFNRETNTLCSKSSDIDLTQMGLSLKSVIEQFREQAANVE